MRRWLATGLAVTALLVVALTVVTRAEGITISGYFSDDNGTTFEEDIDAIAKAGITRGCNPPANNLYCPDDDVDRGQMAAFLRRALKLPSSNTDFFNDDNSSTFEGDIDAIAQKGITRGCNPPANSLYCPQRDVSRGEMAAFLRRGLELPAVILGLPVGRHGAMVCAKDGKTCRLTVDLSAGRLYRVQEGLFQTNPASSSEQSAFDAGGTSFSLTLDGSNVSLTEIPRSTRDGVTRRYWRRDITFTSGSHTVVGKWRWNGQLIQTNTIIIRASG